MTVLFAAAGGEGAAVLLELGILCVAISFAARLATRFGLSPIPLYLVGGLFIGAGSPFALDVSEQFVQTAATIGVVLLLFFLGLEYTARELVGNLKEHAPAGAVDLLNGVPGFVAGLALGWGPTAAAVLAGVTYISSSGVIAKLLRDFGRLGNRETPVILSVLVMEDLFMALYLPILSGLLAGGTALAIGLNAAVGIVLVVVVIAVAARYGDRISSLVWSRSEEVLLFSVLGLVFLVGGVAERIGVSAGVGAFLAGVALSGRAQHQAETLIAPLRDLFAAAFFVFFTYQIDPATLTETALPAIALAIVTGATKVATGWWTARRAGIGRAGQVRTGITLVARGEFSIVIAGLAVVNGADPKLGAFTATYVLVLAIATPLLVRWVNPGAKGAKDAKGAPVTPG